MIIFKKAGQLSEFIRQQKNSGKKTGFVPTMGALHEGHLSLVKWARDSNGIVVCSIFINPTQFNKPEDLKHYPVTIEKDIEKLVLAQCDGLFLPSVEEIYPSGYEPKHYELGELEFILEGKYRPGHFQGVCQVVDRLLEIISPENIYLGQKDFQQCMVIKKLIELLQKEKEIELNIIPTMREPDGLAMSSRNLRLDSAERIAATAISKELKKIKEDLHKKAFHELTETAKKHLAAEHFNVDYVEIANALDLSEAQENNMPLVVLAAATIGKVRLIDNMLLN